MAANDPEKNIGPGGYNEESNQYGPGDRFIDSGRDFLNNFGGKTIEKGLKPARTAAVRTGIRAGNVFAEKTAGTALGKAATAGASKLAGKGVGVTIGAAVGEVATPIGAAVGAAVGWVFDKTIGWVNKHKAETAAIIIGGAVGGIAAASIPGIFMGGFLGIFMARNIVLWFTSLASTALAILIVFIGTPLFIALTIHVINTGAWVVPPWSYEQTNFDSTPLDSPYIEVTKTPQPRFQYENEDLLPNGISVEYVITIVAERSVLSNLSIDYSCSAINEGGTVPCPTIEAVLPNPDGPAIPVPPDQISPQDPFTFVYRQVFTEAGGFEDTRITDTITITATAEGIDGERSAAQATVLIGEPPGPDECPGAGGEVSGSFASTLINGSVRYLPPSSQREYCITPTVMTIHWSAGSNDNPNGSQATYNTLASRGLSCLLASDTNDVLVMIPMYQNQVQMAACSGGDWNNYAVDIEIAGTYFVAPPPPPNNDTIDIALDSVCKLMNFYGLNWTQIRGHYEIQPGKIDPGEEFLHEFFIPELRNRCPGI